MPQPILSIVIANYNYGRFLDAAISSILRQCGEPLVDGAGRAILPIKGLNRYVELIICDAASTDNSIEVIRIHANHIAWWCSEKDHGQSEAFNKGFSHARGKWLTWLNADEMYLRGALMKFSNFVEHYPQAEWVTSNDLSFDDATRSIVYASWGPHRQPVLLKGPRAPFAVFGPTSFWRRELYLQIGPIDEKLHFAMDFDYWIRLTVAGVRQYRLNCHTWAFRIHKESKTSGERSMREIEIRKAEYDYLQEKSGYHYLYSWRNPWYLIWLACRFLDGSLFVRWWMRQTLLGRSVDECL